MNTLEHAARQALEALESCTPEDTTTSYYVSKDYDESAVYEAITTLREALKPNREGKYYYKDNACTADSADSPDCICWHDKALAEQAEQEPVAEVVVRPLRGDQSQPTTDIKWLQRPTTGKLYTAPQPVNEVELTDREIEILMYDFDKADDLGFARAVIAAYKEKNLIK